MLISVADLIRYRRRTEPQVRRVVTTSLPTEHGPFQAVGYAGLHDGAEHMALVAGPIDGGLRRGRPGPRAHRMPQRRRAALHAVRLPPSARRRHGPLRGRGPRGRRVPAPGRRCTSLRPVRRPPDDAARPSRVPPAPPRAWILADLGVHRLRDGWTGAGAARRVGSCSASAQRHTTPHRRITVHLSGPIGRHSRAALTTGRYADFDASPDSQDRKWTLVEAGAQRKQDRGHSGARFPGRPGSHPCGGTTPPRSSVARRPAPRTRSMCAVDVAGRSRRVQPVHAQLHRHAAVTTEHRDPDDADVGLDLG